MFLFEPDVRLSTPHGSTINTSLYKLAEPPFGAGVCLAGLLLTSHILISSSSTIFFSSSTIPKPHYNTSLGFWLLLDVAILHVSELNGPRALLVWRVMRAGSRLSFYVACVRVRVRAR